MSFLSRYCDRVINRQLLTSNHRLCFCGAPLTTEEADGLAAIHLYFSSFEKDESLKNSPRPVADHRLLNEDDDFATTAESLLTQESPSPAMLNGSRSTFLSSIPTSPAWSPEVNARYPPMWPLYDVWGRDDVPTDV